MPAPQEQRQRARDAELYALASANRPMTIHATVFGEPSNVLPAAGCGAEFPPACGYDTVVTGSLASSSLSPAGAPRRREVLLQHPRPAHCSCRTHASLTTMLPPPPQCQPRPLCRRRRGGGRIVGRFVGVGPGEGGSSSCPRAAATRRQLVRRPLLPPLPPVRPTAVRGFFNILVPPPQLPHPCFPDHDAAAPATVSAEAPAPQEQR